jgi:hypothetical protein
MDPWGDVICLKCGCIFSGGVWSHCEKHKSEEDIEDFELDHGDQNIWVLASVYLIIAAGIFAYYFFIA